LRWTNAKKSGHIVNMAVKLMAFAWILPPLLGAGLFLGQDFQLRTKVELVVVPVSVRDNNGSLVRNLTKDALSLPTTRCPEIGRSSAKPK